MKKKIWILFIAFFISIFSTQPSSANWIIEEIPFPGYIWPTVELPIGQDYTKIHMLGFGESPFGGSKLLLAVRDESSWQIEEVYSLQADMVWELGVTSSKNSIGVAFKDLDDNLSEIILFGKKEEGQWTFENIIPDVSGTPFLSGLQSDLLGNFHLVLDVDTGEPEDYWKTVYMKKTEESWQQEVLPELTTSLLRVIDNTPWLRAAVKRAKGYSPGLCHKDSESWSCELLPWTSGWIFFLSDLSFDSNHQPLLLIPKNEEGAADSLYLLRKIDSQWHVEQISEPIDYLNNSLLSYYDDSVVVAYSTEFIEVGQPCKGELYAMRESTGWTTELIDQTPTEYGSIWIYRLLTRNNKVGVIYMFSYYVPEEDEGYSELKFAYEKGFYPSGDDDDTGDDDIDDDNDTAGEKNESGCGCIT